MSALARSYADHARKLLNGQSTWERSHNGYCHSNRVDSLTTSKIMGLESERILQNHMKELYK